MIARLQRRFVAVCAASVLAVFGVVFALFSFFSVQQLDRTMDALTGAIAENDGVFPLPDPDGQGPARPLPYPDVITEETPFSTRFFTVRLDSGGSIARVDTGSVHSIDRGQAERFAAAALAEGGERGWVEDYRFLAASSGEGALLVFVNGEIHKNLCGRLLVTALLTLLCCAFLILTLVVLISRRAVRPLAESYEKQKQFVTDAGHELKTPLTLILSNADILRSEGVESEWLADISAEGERMRLLIDQMVTLSRMDEAQPAPVLEEVDLSRLAAEAAAEFAPLAAERGKVLTAEIEPGLRCLGDEALVRRLAFILLDNAVKYCDEGGSIRLRLAKRRRAVLTVENTFAGAQSLETDRLFDRFYRADKSRSFTGSFGLGLAIARSIAGQLHGSLKAETLPGAVRFRLELREG